MKMRRKKINGDKQKIRVGILTVLGILLTIGIGYTVINNMPKESEAGATAILGTYYVSPTGNDSNNGTSRLTPFKTITKAISVVKPGYEIRVLPGTYKEALTISSKKASQSAPIRIIGDSSSVSSYPIIDGADPLYTRTSTDRPGIKIVGSSWIILERLNFKDHSQTTYLIDNSSYVVIRRNVVKYNKYAVRSVNKSNHILMEYNDIKQNLPTTYSWTSLKDSKYEGGAYVSFGGAGYIEIRNNYIHDMFNGVYLYNGSRRGGYYDSNIFIHHNKFVNIIDDPYEPESYAFNNHFYNNVLIDVHRLLSVAPDGDQKLGPVYVYGNYMVVSKDPTKESVSKGRINSALKVELSPVWYTNGVYFFNNTVDVNTTGIKGFGIDVLNKTFNKIYSYNNIFVTPSNVYTSTSLTLRNSILKNNMSNKPFGYSEAGSWANTNPLLNNRLNEDGRLQSTSPAKGKAMAVTVPSGFTNLTVVPAGGDLGAYKSTGSMYTFPSFKYLTPSGGEMLGFPTNVAWPADVYGGTNPKVTPKWVP